MKVNSIVLAQPNRNIQKFSVTENKKCSDRELWTEANNKAEDLEDLSAIAIISLLLLGGWDLFDPKRKMCKRDWVNFGLLAIGAASMIASWIKRYSVYRELKHQQNDVIVK